jgi:hypothetical protein
MSEDPDPDLWPTDPDPGGPKTYGSDGPGSATQISGPAHHELKTVDFKLNVGSPPSFYGVVSELRERRISKNRRVLTSGIEFLVFGT